MKHKLEWMPVGPNTIGAVGYAVQIHRTHGSPPFKLVAFGSELGYWTLASAKQDAEERVAEQAEFDEFQDDAGAS